MSFSEKIRELDREIGDRVERAMADVRRDLGERLRRGTEEILQRFEEVRPDLPSSLLGDVDVATVEEQVRTTARRGALADLREGLAGIDRARSQAEILNALLAGSGRFCSRAAVLLARGGELRGWASRGFPEGEPSIREVALGQDQDGAWTRFGEGQGVVHLSAAECAALCSRLESPLPQAGVLVPLVLRDRVAAALYADRTGGDELTVEALQSLAYVAAQAIETLPFRERSSTPTLYSGEEAAAEPSAAEPAPAEGAHAGAAAEQDTAVEAEPVTASATEPETEIEPAAAPAPEADAEEIAAPAEAAATGDPSAWGATGDPSAWGAAGDPSAWRSAPAEPEPEPSAAEPALSGDPSAWGLASAAPAAPEPTAAPPEPSLSEMGRETVLLQRPVPVPEPIPSPFAPPQEESAPREPAEPAAPRLRPVGFAPAPESDEAARAGGGTVEVPPPSGVQGPGWAFATTRVPVSADEEAIHEEARRLARLLVSEIKLYNEDQVEEGRRNRDLYERLKEDIDRSRQMYEERVEPRVLNSTDYFYQELVRILAGGDARALGI